MRDYEIYEKVPRDVIRSLLPRQESSIFKAFMKSRFRGATEKRVFQRSPKIFLTSGLIEPTTGFFRSQKEDFSEVFYGDF